MGETFITVGVAILSSTKRSVRLELSAMPNTTFTEYIYISVNDLEALLNGRKKTATIYKLKDKE